MAEDEAWEPIVCPEDVECYSMDQARAFFNWIGLEEDRSMGVHNPSYYEALLDNTIEALADYLAPVETIVIRGEASLVDQWRASVQKVYAPTRVVLAIPTAHQALPEGLAAHRAPAAGALAYVCRGARCLAAIDNWRDLAGAIRRR